MQVITDIGLAHGDTDRQRRIRLGRIFTAESCHGIVDHPYLRPISVGYDDFTIFFNEIDNRFSRNLNGFHLFGKCITQGVPAQSNDNPFLFLFHMVPSFFIYIQCLITSDPMGPQA